MLLEASVVVVGERGNDAVGKARTPNGHEARYSLRDSEAVFGADPHIASF